MKRALILSFFFCVLLILLASIKTPTYYDEGWAATNAFRILNHEIPYLDFWLTYPPAEFYFLAAIFKMYGSNLIIARFFDILVKLFITIAIFKITPHVTSRLYAYFCASVAALLLSTSCSFLYAAYPAFLLGLLALICFQNPKALQSLRSVFFAGFFSGLCCLFRVDFGLYISVTITITILLFLKTNATNQRDVAKYILVYWGSVLLFSLPVYTFLVLKCGFKNITSQIILFPFLQMHEYRWLPLPGLIPQISDLKTILQWFRFYLPIYTYISFFTWFIIRMKKNDLRHICAFSISLFGLLLFVQAINRYDLIHVAPTSIIAWLSISSMIDLNGTSAKARKTLWIAILPIYLFFIARPIYNIKEFVFNYTPWKSFSEISVAGGIPVAPDRALAVQHIQRITANNDLIFVCNSRHDRVFISDPGFYFLAQRKCASFYHDLFPGVITTRKVQKRIIKELDSLAVNNIVQLDLPESLEPNKSSHSSSVRLLDDYISTNYCLIFKYESYAVLRRNL